MKLFVLLTVVSLAEAQGQDSLSLREAVRLSLAHNKGVEAATAAVDAASARITQARSGILPKVSYSESWTRSDNPVFVFSSLLTQHQFSTDNFQIGPLNRPDFLNNFQSVVTVDQPVYDAGRTKRAVHSAELGKEVAREDTRRTELDVITQAVGAYYDAQLEAEQMRALDQAMKSAESDLDRAEARKAAGMATDLDVLSIRVHISEVKEQQIRHAANLDVARAALNDALGFPLDTQHMLSTQMVPLLSPQEALAEVEKTAADNRPEARQAKLALDMAETQKAEARSNLLLPQVGVRGAFEADRQRFYNRGGANWLVSLGLRWNLFNGFADKARVEETVAATRRSQAEQQRADSAIRLQVRRAWADLAAARQRIDTAAATVAQAEESLRISQNRYEAGFNTITDLLRTESALLETRMRYQAAVHDQRIAAVMLESAAGSLSAESEVLN